jgi:hypothetical protein
MLTSEFRLPSGDEPHNIIMISRWYLHRLWSMSPPELLYRFQEQARRARWRNYRDGWRRFGIGDGPLPIVPDLGSRLEAACTLAPALRERITVEVGLLRSGTVSLLGQPWPAGTLADLRVRDRGLFLRDPQSGKEWPGADAYCFDVPYRSVSDRGDIKYLHEINRLQFLQVAAAEAYLTRNSSLAQNILGIFSAWMDANLPFLGPNWRSGIELALRLVTLVIVLSFLGSVANRETRELLRAFAHAHAFWLARYPSRFSSANNHLVAESLGVFLAGILIPDLPFAERMAANARGTLELEATRQFFDDGIGVEQSPTYAAFSLELFGFAALIGQLVGRPFSMGFERRLTTAAESLCWFTDDSGHAPAIGDNDEGRVIALTLAPEQRYVPSVAASIGGLTRRVDLILSQRDPELRDAIFATPAAPTKNSRIGMRVFEAGGYTVVREAGNCFLLFAFDHGPLGHLSIAAHGHADALAIWLHVNNVPVLVDAGTFLYHAGGSQRDFFRSTAAHNTVVVENEGASLPLGPFNWLSKANARLVSHRGPPFWAVEAEHDGYKSRFGVVHRRAVTRTSRGIDVTDCLVGTGASHAVSIRFLFSANLHATADGARWSMTLGDGTKVSLEGPPGFDCVSCRADEVIPAGWISPRFGDRQPTDQLIFNGRVGTQPVTTRIVIEPAT